jgi:hypothetical protein
MKHATYFACEEVNYEKPDKLVEVRNVYALDTNTERYGYINRLETRPVHRIDLLSQIF